LVNWAKEFWSQKLNHIIEDKEQELLFGFQLNLFYLRDHFREQLLDEVLAEGLVSFEKASKNLCETELKLGLILVFLLENHDVLFIEFIIFLTILIFCFVFVIVVNPVFGLLDKFKDLFDELVNAIFLQQVVSSLINDFFDGLGLSNEAFGLSFRVHSLDDIVAVRLGHFVDDSNIIWLCLFGAFDQACKGSCR